MKRSLAYLFAAVLFCVGCSLTSLQTPEVMPPGRTLVGLGLAYFPNVGLPEADLLYRHGISSTVDMGAKIAVPNLSISADVKWQFLKKPLLMAFDFGGSYGYAPAIPDEADYSSDIFTACPELIVGNRRFYAAVRPVIMYGIEHLGYGRGTRGSAYAFPQIFVGATIGRKFTVTPELSLGYLFEQPGAFLPGFGAAFHWGS